MQLELPVIDTERLLVRMCYPEEAIKSARYHLKNRDYLQPFYATFTKESFSEIYWAEELERNIVEYYNDQSMRLFIFEKDNEEIVVGTVSFSGIVRRAAYYCVLGYGLDQDFQGRGYMTEALDAAIDYMFTEKNMHRVMANYIPTNEKSGKVLRRLGFTVEGYARDYLYLDGQWKDHILTSLTNECWDWELDRYLHEDLE